MSSEDDSVGFHGYERDALLDLKAGFKNSFLDNNWTSLMCYMNDTPYWYGVQCLNGQVTGLVLDNMGLTGEINVDALVNLTELVSLSFKNNSIAGNMMEFTHNHKLRNINISGNGFDGEIPSSVLNLNSLESLQLQDNNLSGSIPGFNQSTLKAFNVSYNNLSGTIPETKTLQSLSLSSYFGNENLCGPPTPTLCSTRNNLSDSDTVLVFADVIVLVIILFLFMIYYKKFKELKMKRNEEQENTIMDRAMDEGIPKRERGKPVFMENNGMTTFELDDLLKAPAKGLGKGNFGNCYKAMMEIGQVVVVKRVVRQVRAIADQKHPNLMPLLAYYYSEDEKFFLYKFASHGNLFDRLHGGRGTGDRVPFRWSSRLAVARGVGQALKHLHLNTRTRTTAAHGNLKSSNVLLYENDQILVSDYGLTSLIALPIAAQHMASFKCPEYLSHKLISKKSDVWSYGSLLLKLLTGRIPSHSAPPGTNGVDLCSWAYRAVREEWTAEIFDAEILAGKWPEIGQVLAEVEEIKVGGESEDEQYSYSSFDRSLTDDSLSATPSVVIGDDQR
ncbi:Serine/threonine protein kinase [Handroanthus impetiginosus]|uniref:Serine/threonine protein kinase n=1 Tax=Handroanthus impetiginosus TaxID=429701 RepID=A0A2G9G9Z2_9LAMI|nr:Serine/threonine protein kinase [Handroanthus impetiginosus]